MEKRKFLPNIEIENAEWLRGKFLNFEGRPSRYNREGDRNFCVVIPSAEMAQQLLDDGWNIRLLKPRDDEEEPKYYIQVTVGFKFRPPLIRVMKRNRHFDWDESLVHKLDSADIEAMDVVIRPRFYERDDGSTGVKAYLKELYVTVNESRFAAKYAEEEHPEE